MTKDTKLDVIVVGAGFAGMQMLYRLRGLGFSVRALESGDGVGGTWFWNRYPGARCDVESMQYSYQFSEELQQEWDWTERYATQPEILRYANHVADRFDLRRDIEFGCRVASAIFDEEDNHWCITTEDGTSLVARFCVMATGSLSSAAVPEIDGLDTFNGQYCHTGEWPTQALDLSTKRVAVIGTGSSGIQAIPELARTSAHLTVFQRTPGYSLPAHNAPLSQEAVTEIKNNYSTFCAANKAEWGGVSYPGGMNATSALDVSEAERNREFETRWETGGVGFLSSFSDLLFLPESNEMAARFIREKIRAEVNDPELAEALCPDVVVGCKRICLDTEYYATFNRDNVTLVSVKDQPIEKITPKGLITGDQEYEFDCIVFATGFDAMTGALLKMDIQGRNGQTLQQKWSEGAPNYLGLCVHGFPNIFSICGPGSPSVLTNVLVSIDQHVNWIADCIESLRERQVQCIEAESTAEALWVEHGNEIVDLTLFTACNSWYAGANIPGKPQGFMPYAGGLPAYTAKCAEVAANNYEGFKLS
ncbi:MAG: NAD(P)/FAD-dependent oxidoreductase [Halioglobus sp.]